jgi:hypothetical protein
METTKQQQQSKTKGINEIKGRREKTNLQQWWKGKGRKTLN